MDRQCFVPSATIRGVEALPVSVEVSVGEGLPGITIVGMPDSTVQESKIRVRSALRACGYSVPPARISVNLAPSSLKKVGSGFDLPIAIGILVCTGQIPRNIVEERTFVGELSLDGSVHGVSGLFAVAVMVAAGEGGLVTGLTADDLEVALPGRHEVLATLGALRLGEFRAPEKVAFVGAGDELDFADIAAQDLAKRAMQIAAVGGHALFMMGPPGSGKTMLARRLPTIMPPLADAERLECALVHSVCGLEYQDLLAGRRPFRRPHHSATAAGLLGGGSPVLPGEVSLSHNGILFLDEMPEFGGKKLQLLRQPMEDHVVLLARADGVYRFPARFLLVGAANPCPCGYLGDPERTCSCTPSEVERYQSRIGGPLKDRFDMMISVKRADPKTVLATGSGVSSSSMREEVLAAREFALYRLKPARSQGHDALLIDECRLDEVAGRCIEHYARAFNMSGRGIMKALSVARTIADMQESDRVTDEHISEAIVYRMQDNEEG
ncbi:MAG: YifB family Mg chelatase-like AAA ATPase [Coriobacteriales bacterium]|jgi:magnesium chelatase family protein